MTIAEFVANVDDRRPPAPQEQLDAFEAEIGHRLPIDYREFLVMCNGGFVAGAYWFTGPTPEGDSADAGVRTNI
jgi:hypothetical protein